jgi:hypothetical protein
MGLIVSAKDHELWIEYHGAELGPNQFTILINGQRLSAEENLKNSDLPIRSPAKLAAIATPTS